MSICEESILECVRFSETGDQNDIAGKLCVAGAVVLYANQHVIEVRLVSNVYPHRWIKFDNVWSAHQYAIQMISPYFKQ